MELFHSRAYRNTVGLTYNKFFQNLLLFSKGIIKIIAYRLLQLSAEGRDPALRVGEYDASARLDRYDIVI